MPPPVRVKFALMGMESLNEFLLYAKKKGFGGTEPLFEFKILVLG